MLPYAVGLLGGVVMGWCSAYLLAIKPLINDIRFMRRLGYMPLHQKEERTEPELKNPHFSVED